MKRLAAHFFAYESVMLCVGLILNPCSPESATALRVSESNSTKAMPGFASTMHLREPGELLEQHESIDAVVASARAIAYTNDRIAVMCGEVKPR